MKKLPGTASIIITYEMMRYIADNRITRCRRRKNSKNWASVARQAEGYCRGEPVDSIGNRQADCPRSESVGGNQSIHGWARVRYNRLPGLVLVLKGEAAWPAGKGRGYFMLKVRLSFG